MVTLTLFARLEIQSEFDSMVASTFDKGEKGKGEGENLFFSPFFFIFFPIF